MIVLQAKNLSKSFGAYKILNSIQLIIEDNERIGLIGANGAGKTTLLRCLSGEESCTEGEVIKGGFTRIGYMQQLPAYPISTTVFGAVLDSFNDILEMREKLTAMEEKMAQGKKTDKQELEKTIEQYGRLNENYERAGGFACEAITRRVIRGLGFSEKDFKRTVNSLSGGEKTKVSLARLLVRNYELLLLDEPTNHLDLQSVEWLEDFLKNHRGAFMIISHDRYFLDQVTKRTLELENKTLKSYRGSFSSYTKQKEEELSARQKAYDQQQKYIAITEQYIEKYRAGIKSKQARGRQTRLENLERVEQPVIRKRICLDPEKHRIEQSAGMVLKIDDLSLTFATRRLWSKVSFVINKGQKIALVGPNGSGKTSLLKIIQGKLEATEGEIRIGARVRPGFFDQQHEDLIPESTVLEETMRQTELTIGEARSMLGGFLFHEDEVFKKVRDLSGGEKSRLSLLRLMLQKPNFLILDEPTNHLDIASKEVIERYLQAYPGTLLVVSHDRYFLDRVTEQTLEIDNCDIIFYAGSYSYMKQKKTQMKEEHIPQHTTEIAVKPSFVRAQKARAQNEKNLLKQQCKHLENEIEAMEATKKQLEQEMADKEFYLDESQAKKKLQEYQKLCDNIPEFYERWENLIKLLDE